MHNHKANTLVILVCVFALLAGCRGANVNSLSSTNQSPQQPIDAREHRVAIAPPTERTDLESEILQASHQTTEWRQTREAASVQSEAPATRDTLSAGELSLTDVINAVLESSPDVQSAIERTWIADATLDRARAEFYPTLSVSENYGLSDNPVNAFSFQLSQAQLSFNQDFNNPQTTDNFDTRLRVQHGIYTGGRRVSEREAATWQLQAAHADLETVQNQLVFRAAEAYYRLLQASELVQVREEAVRQVTQHLEIVRSRYRAETAVKSDVLSVEVQLAETKQALITVRHQVELAWAVLDNVVGRPLPRQPLPDTIPPAPWSERSVEIQQAIATALDNRAEVTQLSSQYQSALYGVEAARSGKRPAVNFVGDYDVFTGDFRRGNDSFFVGLVVELNLLDGGRTRSEVARASARARELSARYRRLVSDIELDVRRAYLQLSDAQARLKVAEQAIEQAQESLREVEVRYRGQTATITRLIDAQVALSNSRVRRANAQAEVEVARASLERAVGRLHDIPQP